MRFNVAWQEWMRDALCAQVDPELFFAEKSAWAVTIQAKLICRRCPVIAECLEYAVANNENFGVWGGTTPKQRQRLRGFSGVA